MVLVEGYGLREVDGQGSNARDLLRYAFSENAPGSLCRCKVTGGEIFFDLVDDSVWIIPNNGETRPVWP